MKISKWLSRVINMTNPNSRKVFLLKSNFEMETFQGILHNIISFSNYFVISSYPVFEHGERELIS